MTFHRLLPIGAFGCALLTGVVLVLTRPTGSEPGPVERRVLTSSGSFAVGERWTRTAGDALLYYADPADPGGRPLVGLAGAVVADAGYCAGLPTSNRGFAGFSDVPGGRDLPGATLAAASAWATGIVGRDPPPLEPRPIRLGDGTAATRVSVRLRAPASGDPCVSRRVLLDVVGFRAATGVATLVVVRDDDPAGVSDAEVEGVVQSLRRRT